MMLELKTLTEIFCKSLPTLLGSLEQHDITSLTYDQTLVFENRELMKGGEEKRP